MTGTYKWMFPLFQLSLGSTDRAIILNFQQVYLSNYEKYQGKIDELNPFCYCGSIQISDDTTLIAFF